LQHKGKFNRNLLDQFGCRINFAVLDQFFLPVLNPACCKGRHQNFCHILLPVLNHNFVTCFRSEFCSSSAVLILSSSFAFQLAKKKRKKRGLKQFSLPVCRDLPETQDKLQHISTSNAPLSSFRIFLRID
jgi:hypothetical protein